MKAKLVVLEKSVFQAEKYGYLKDFVRKYRVLLPHTLAMECLISDDCSGAKPAKNPNTLLRRIESLVIAGAYFGRSSASIREEEKETRRAAVRLIDTASTDQFRRGNFALTENSVPDEARNWREAFSVKVTSATELVQAFVRHIRQMNLISGFQEEIRGTDRMRLFSKGLWAADHARSDLLQRFMASVAACATEHWYSWQLMRLWFGWATDWAGRRAGSGDSALKTDVSNDLYDIEYVASLSIADGLLTRDKPLVDPLARAAFPKKDVFSRLEDVSDAYRSDRSDG